MENVLIESVDLHPDAIDLFQANKLVRVGFLHKQNTGWHKPVMRNLAPGNKLFNNITRVTLVDNGWNIEYQNGTIWFLEKAESDGIDYRLYNAANKEDANYLYLLVKGGEQRDLYEVNLAVELQYLTPDTTIVWNRSTFNGKLYDSITPNSELMFAGFQWYFHGVDNPDRDFIQGDFIANDGTRDTNKGAGDRRFCIITRDPNVPILKKGEIDPLGITGAHYYIDFEKESNDPETEFLTMFAYTRTKHSHRGEMDYTSPEDDLWISLDQIFPLKTEL